VLPRCFVRHCAASAAARTVAHLPSHPPFSPRAHPNAPPLTPRTDRLWISGTALPALARPMAFYVLFALLVLCSGQTTSPTTSPSPTRTPSCSAPPGYFCSGGSALICPIGAYCAGGSALNVSCYPVTACTVAGLSVQPPCYWNVSTLAGSGTTGYADGFGSAARFNNPCGIALINSTYYVVDSVNRRIRVVTSNGTVSTLAGSGAAGQSNGQGTTATFNSPLGLVYHASLDRLIVSHVSGGAIRLVSLAGAVSTLVSFGFSSPANIALNSSGSFFIGDVAANVIRIVTSSGVVSTYAGTGALGNANGAALSSTFNYPAGVAVDTLGNVYVSERNGNFIRLISQSSYTVKNYIGTGTAATVDGYGTSALTKGPEAMVFDSVGTLFLCEMHGNTIRRINTQTAYITTVVGTGISSYTDGWGLFAGLNFPRGLIFNIDGIALVTDGNNGAIRQLTCVPCPSSYYCFSGAPVLCPAGSYCPLSSINATLCPKGTFSNAGASNCTLCPAGTFTSSTGSTSCQRCPGGHYCPAGTSSWARLNCGRGNYCPDGSGAPTPCPYQVPPNGGWGDLKVQGPAFLLETAHCLNHCFWNFTSGDGMLSKC
jgi:hypothetical protein